jgi:hypothetical protein
MTQQVMTNDEAVTGSKKIFFAIFGTFGRFVTNLRGTFVETVKKSKFRNFRSIEWNQKAYVQIFWDYPFKSGTWMVYIIRKFDDIPKSKKISWYYPIKRAVMPVI